MVVVTDEHRTATEYAPSCDLSASSFHFTPVNSELTQKLLQHLNVQKSSGPDGISSRFLKEVASEVAEPLSKLCNTSLQTSSIPSEWKQCNITAVRKAGCQNDPSNYHPISVVPIIAKTLKRLWQINLINTLRKINF